MKKLIALIFSGGKSKEQLTDEMYAAVQKYFRAEEEVIDSKQGSIVDATEDEEK